MDEIASKIIEIVESNAFLTQTIAELNTHLRYLYIGGSFTVILLVVILIGLGIAMVLLFKKLSKIEKLMEETKKVNFYFNNKKH